MYVLWPTGAVWPKMFNLYLCLAVPPAGPHASSAVAASSSSAVDACAASSSSDAAAAAPKPPPRCSLQLLDREPPVEGSPQWTAAGVKTRGFGLRGFVCTKGHESASLKTGDLICTRAQLGLENVSLQHWLCHHAVCCLYAHTCCCLSTWCAAQLPGVKVDDAEAAGVRLWRLVPSECCAIYACCRLQLVICAAVSCSG